MISDSGLLYWATLYTPYLVKLLSYGTASFIGFVHSLRLLLTLLLPSTILCNLPAHWAQNVMSAEMIMSAISLCRNSRWWKTGVFLLDNKVQVCIHVKRFAKSNVHYKIIKHCNAFFLNTILYTDMEQRNFKMINNGENPATISHMSMMVQSIHCDQDEADA